MFPQSFTCSAVLTRDKDHKRIFVYAPVTLFGGPSHVLWLICLLSSYPGFFSFARRYLRNRVFFLFLRLLRCFSSPGSLRNAMYSRYGDCPPDSRVSSFGDLRFNGYVLLGAAFRSLSRPSSAPSAMASALCSCFFDLCRKFFAEEFPRVTALIRKDQVTRRQRSVSFEKICLSYKERNLRGT